MSANPLHYALVVGIREYPGGYPLLSGPVNDARAFRDWLVDPEQGGLPPDNIRRIESPPAGTPMRVRDARPTKEMIDDSLWELVQLARAAQGALPEAEQADARADSRLYLFVAGHGIMPAGGDAALLDAKAEPGRRTHLELGAYRRWLNDDGTFGELCIFADCCRTYEPLALISGAPSLEPPMERRGRVYALTGWATEGGGTSREDVAPGIPPDQRRGFFSQALIEGLRGGALDPDTGYVTDQILTTYMDSMVRHITASARPGHEPQKLEMLTNPLHPIRFGPRRSGRRPEYKVTIAFSEEAPVRVTLTDPQNTSTISWQTQDGPWVVRLYDGLWILRYERASPSAAGAIGAGRIPVTDLTVIQVSGADLDVTV